MNRNWNKIIIICFAWYWKHEEYFDSVENTKVSVANDPICINVDLHVRNQPNAF